MAFIRAEFAGSWYPGNKNDLIKELDSYFSDKKYGPGELPKSLNQSTRSIIGGTSPHAGYIYSGCCAANTYLNLFRERVPDTIVILGTDHQGIRKVFMLDEGEWETPLGNLKVDDEITKKILEMSKIIVDDRTMFSIGEHNIEIQLPFIKYCAGNKEVKIVPITITTLIDLEKLTQIAKDITAAIANTQKDIVFVASSDMSHEQVSSKEELKVFKERDQQFIDGFTNLNPQKTFTPYPHASICGKQSITTLVLIGKILHAKNGTLLKYYTSSEKTGHFGYCVGYFSGILKK